MQNTFGAVIVYANNTISSLIQTLQLCCVRCQFWNFTKSTAKRVAGCTAGRELHPALKNPDIRLCKTFYRFADLKYIPACREMQEFFRIPQNTKAGDGSPGPRFWEE